MQSSLSRNRFELWIETQLSPHRKMYGNHQSLWLNGRLNKRHVWYKWTKTRPITCMLMTQLIKYEKQQVWWDFRFYCSNSPKIFLLGESVDVLTCVEGWRKEFRECNGSGSVWIETFIGLTSISTCTCMRPHQYLLPVKIHEIVVAALIHWRYLLITCRLLKHLIAIFLVLKAFKYCATIDINVLTLSCP